LYSISASLEDEVVVPGVSLVIEEEKVVAAVVASSEIDWERWNVGDIIS
jgi:hypothetical protein